MFKRLLNRLIPFLIDGIVEALKEKFHLEEKKDKV